MTGMRRAFATVLLVVAGAMVISIAWAWRQSRQTPEWWAPVNPAAPEVEVAGEQFETRIVNETRRVRPESETWRIRIDENAVNAWLAARFPKWAESQFDGESIINRLSETHVRIEEEGVIRLGARYGERDEGQPLSIAMRLMMTEDGRVVGEIEDAAAGRLPLPATMVLDEILPRLDDALAAAILDAEPIDPVIPLGGGDDRTIRIVSLDFEPGALTLRAKTESDG
ncbi:MAG: hypothetical protein ACF8PN_05155 [Phycisphaerales bacterium]